MRISDWLSGSWIMRMKKWRMRRGFTKKDPAVGFIADIYIVLEMLLTSTFSRSYQ